MLAHLAVALTAGLVTTLVTPLIARLARRLRMLEESTDARTGERRRVPSLGGLAMLCGFLAAMGAAWLLPVFRPLFTTTSEPLALLVGVGVIVAVGLIDDVVVLPPTIKLAGQILAALGVVLFGVQLVYFWIPGVEIVALSADLGLPLTIIALVVMINALNLIDGLDGLAAGVAAIGAVAFFAFAMRTQPAGAVDAIPTSATLVAAMVAGMALGFLVHNWYPARIFMGDTGAMLLGLLLGAAGVAYVGRTTAPSSADFTGAIPLLVPALVLAVPFLDTVFAVVRRLVQGQPIAVGDRGHLHHLLVSAGHTHRQAVLVLYYWSAVVAFGSVGPAFMPMSRVVPWVIGTVAVGLVVTMVGARELPSAAERALRQPADRAG